SCFILACFAWTAVLSSKYSHPILSSRSLYGQANVDSNSITMPVINAGITELPDNYSTSAWDEPSNYFHPDKSSFFSNSHLVFKNAQGFFRNHLSIYQLIIFILFLPFLIERYKRKLLLPATIAVIFTAGYLLFHNEDRFYWPVVVMLMLGITIGFEIVFENVSRLNFFRLTALLLIAFLFSFRPIMRLKNDADKTFYKFYSALHNQKFEYLETRRFASLNGRWDHGLFATYALNGTYFGVAKPSTTKEQLQQDLLNYDIDCLLVFNNETNKDIIPIPVSIISISNLGLKIYCYK
ncbi:MAG: hypothetical protein ABUT20_63640, partial [Bacteroidota bacterium]